MREGVTIVLDGTAGKINDEQENFLNIAKRNIDRLTVLINDVLDFQKFNAGKMTLNIQENDMEEIAKEVHETMILAAKKNDISLTLESADKLPLIKCDKDKIIQVLTNLINNAIKFTPSKGHVTVRLEQQNNELLLHVIDTGMGIPKESLPKILDRFYRVNRPGKEIQGTGLGLAIVNKIVKLHKGKIEIESELDQGTTVTVSLPLVSEPVPEPLSEEADDFLEKTLV
jgi:signal transduction histidine kinase